MGFFDGFLGGIKNIGNSVVGAVKTVGKKIGDAGQSVLDFTRQHSIGTILQDVGGGATILGGVLEGTIVGAPLGAVTQGIGGAAFLAGTGLRSLEIASNRNLSAGDKALRGATDVGLALVLPSVLRKTGRVIGASGRLGVRAADKASKVGIDAVKSAGRTVVKRSPAALKPYAADAARGAEHGARYAGKALKKSAAGLDYVTSGFESGTTIFKTTGERYAAAKGLSKVSGQELKAATRGILKDPKIRRKVGIGIGLSAAAAYGAKDVQDNVNNNQTNVKNNVVINR